MQNKVLNIQPASLANAVANVLNCAITSVAGPVGMTATQPYLIVKHIRAVNTTGAAATFNLFKGATGGSAAGTEIAKGVSIPANSYVDVFYGQMRLDSTDFISGFASAAATITVMFDAEIGFA